MKRYEYRLICLRFDKFGNMDTTDNGEVPPLQPGERILKTTGGPEFMSGSNTWTLPVLLEREVTCSPLSGETDVEKLTALLKGELK